MTRFILILICLSSAAGYARHEEERSNHLLRFIAEHEFFRNFALKTVMKKRCSKYLPSHESRFCDRGVDELVATLDQDLVITETGFVFLAFKSDTFALLQDTETLRFLTLLQTRLDQFLANETQHLPNLWELALSFYTEPKLAARTLAALFQDTSPKKLHLAYLQHVRFQGTTATEEILLRLSQTIDTINLILDVHGSRSRELFYPKKVQTKLNRTIYHFYVPYYLSLSLRTKGLTSAALYSPMMLTLSYEFITSAPDTRYVFADPEILDYRHPAHLQKLTDIYGGYLGAALGGNVQPMNFQVVKEGFARSTLFGVGLLLQR